MFRIFVIAITINLFVYSNSHACSSFQLEPHFNTYVGKNYDWSFGDAYVIYNPKGLQKFSLTLKPDQKKTQWVSQHSSLTFNQYGLDFPNGGINEKGLSIEVLWLDESIFPAQDEKAVFNELQWIQYALDTQSTTAGVVQTLETVRIEPIYAKVHYFVCDLERNCTTIEFVNGKAAIGTYEKYGFDVITNSTHKDSMSYLSLFKNFGGNYNVIWENYASLDRFVRLNDLLRTYKDTQDPIEYAFKSLDSVKREKVSVGSYTQWQIVYDKENLVSHFKTTFSSFKVANVSLKSFPPECSQRQYFDLKSKVHGDINDKFQPLTYELNYQLVKTSLKKVMPNAPEDMVKAISGAPFKFECVP
ncbi:MAG: linear amide C-N hydrolase [Bdellovibrionota bacterium]